MPWARSRAPPSTAQDALPYVASCNTALRGASESPLHVGRSVTDVGPAGRHVDLAQACSLATSDTSSENASCPLGPL